MDDVELQPVAVDPVPPVVLQAGKRRNPLPLQNSYAAKKTVAQGMMDVALITANANQMKFVLEYGSESASYYLVLTLLIISLLLQVFLIGIYVNNIAYCSLTAPEDIL
ncbi:hypothetical protein J6590_049940 [Homalodisca vitripennis]|nr:hypothetical protein J6590_049940 [Homalodisca vitripennis]